MFRINFFAYKAQDLCRFHSVLFINIERRVKSSSITEVLVNHNAETSYKKICLVEVLRKPYWECSISS